jgi:hypothetical protein
MKVFGILICILFFFYSVSGQTEIKINDSRASDTSKHYFVLVDTFRTSLQGLILNPSLIESIEVFNSSDAIKKYGADAADGAIIIHAKKNVTLWRLNSFLDKLGSSFVGDVRKCRVCIDEKIIEYPEFILIDESQLTSVSTFDMVDFKNGETKSEKFLNLSTKKKLVSNPQ